MVRSWLIDEQVILFRQFGRTNTSPSYLDLPRCFATLSMTMIGFVTLSKAKGLSHETIALRCIATQSMTPIWQERDLDEVQFPYFRGFHVQKGILCCKIDTGEVYFYEVFFVMRS